MHKKKYKIKVLDNFLHEEDFKELSNLKIDKDINSDFTVYHNEINNDGIIKSVIDKDLLKRIHKNYHFQAIKVLEELCPQKLKLYEYSDFTIIITRKDSKFPIHDDTPNKLLSGVVYLLPENNSGTVFYDDKNGEGKTEMGWKQNRAVFFSRKEKKTWHSYEGNRQSNRIALVYNLMTSNIKKVYEIEKKNYFFGLLRWKINPFLFRFLKMYI